MLIGARWLDARDAAGRRRLDDPDDYVRHEVALGLRDARAVSRANGQIYAAWRLSETPVDEKVARTRAALIFNSGRLILWDEHGDPRVRDESGQWIPFAPAGGRP